MLFQVPALNLSLSKRDTPTGDTLQLTHIPRVPTLNLLLSKKRHLPVTLLLNTLKRFPYSAILQHDRFDIDIQTPTSSVKTIQHTPLIFALAALYPKNKIGLSIPIFTIFRPSRRTLVPILREFSASFDLESK